MMKYVKRIVMALLAMSGVCNAHAEIITYPVPAGIYYARHNDDYTVKIRQAGEKDWIDLYEYNVKVDMDTHSNATMVQFDFSGKVEILVQKNNGEIRSAVVRPLSKSIQPEIDDNFLLFTIDKPQKLSVEFNGDRLNNLHVFANPIIESIPDRNDPSVMYFESGIHEATDKTTGSFRIPSNTIVYLEGGAVLKGRLQCDSVENVRILGHGILLEPQQGVSVAFSKNVVIDGITVVNPRHYTVSGGQSTGITIKNLKSFSCQGWSDGLDFMSCSDILIDNVFMRNSDDCIALYAHRGDYYGDCRNVRVLNSTLWADIAHPINIGTHGNTKTGDEVIENILFKNIDILEHDEDDRDYQGCMAINVGDHNLAQNITFEDIRVENIQEGQLFHLRVMYNSKYNTGPGRGVKNIVFRNISCSGKHINPSLIEGYDRNRKVENILFENIVLNGKRVTSLEELNISRKNFVEKITIQSANPALPGFHADPEILYSRQTGKYYIYSTTDGYPGWSGWAFSVFSSTDLKNWQDEGVMLDLKSEQVPWANGNAWAPCIEEKLLDGKYKYYFYYSGNPIAGGGKQIGVAVADSPTGPFTDLGHPIITTSPIGHGQQIDVDVFTDPVSGKSYLYWGNGYMAGAELNDDMLSIKENTLTVMTPAGGTLNDYAYREAPYVFYRNGIYYFMWSVDDTGSPNYHVAYGTSDSPLGPVKVAEEPVVLIQSPEKEIYGTAHNAVLQIPGTDEWYIVYHRINKDYIERSKRPGIHREVCIDRMEFNKNGTIKKVIPTL